MDKKYANWYEYETSVNTLRTFVPQYLTPSKSHQVAAKVLETDNYIPFKTYLELHPSVREEYKDKVDFDNFINTPASTAKLEVFKKDIESSLDLGLDIPNFNKKAVIKAEWTYYNEEIDGEWSPINDFSNKDVLLFKPCTT